MSEQKFTMKQKTEDGYDILYPKTTADQVSGLSTTLSASSTDSEIPSAKCVYDIIGNVETLLAEI